MVASTASKNSTPRCCRWVSYTGQRCGTLSRLPARTERADSRTPAQLCLRALPYVFPGDPRGLASDRTPCSSLDFGRPGSFDFSGIVCLGCIETCQEFGCHVGTFCDWQRERFAQEFLGSRGHGAILHPERKHTPVENQPSNHAATVDAAQIRAPIRSLFGEQMRLTRAARSSL